MKFFKSNSKDLKSLFEHSINVRHISSVMQTCDKRDKTEGVKRMMEDHSFDVLGITDEDRVIGYILQEEITNHSLEHYIHPFEPVDLISDSTPLVDVLPILAERKRIFVLHKNNVETLVTRADLQKTPVRMLLYGLISLLELHMINLIETHYTIDTMKTALNSRRLEEALSRHEYLQQKNESLDLVDSLYFCDKRDLLVSHNKIPGIFNLSKRQLKMMLSNAENLRNKLAHVGDLVDDTIGWPEIIEQMSYLEAFIKRCEAYDEWWEDNASNSN